MHHNLLPVTHQRPVSVMWTMVAVTTTVLRPYKVISAPAILDTHWTLINTFVLVSKIIAYTSSHIFISFY